MIGGGRGPPPTTAPGGRGGGGRGQPLPQIMEMGGRGGGRGLSLPATTAGRGGGGGRGAPPPIPILRSTGRGGGRGQPPPPITGVGGRGGGRRGQPTPQAMTARRGDGLGVQSPTPVIGSIGRGGGRGRGRPPSITTARGRGGGGRGSPSSLNRWGEEVGLAVPLPTAVDGRSRSKTQSPGTDGPPVEPWRTSRAKAHLKAMLMDPTSQVHRMSALEIFQSDKIYDGYEFKNFATNLRNLMKSLGIVSEDPKKIQQPTPAAKVKKKSPPPWQSSKAKAVLRKLLLDNSSNAWNMTARELFDSDCIFSQYEYNKFYNNLRDLKNVILFEKKQIEFDEKAFESEKAAFPKKETTHRGQPFWPSHPAQAKLREDVKSGRVFSIKPLQLWEETTVYRDFDTLPFRKHVHQEINKQRSAKGWQYRRNWEARKEFEAEVEELKEKWKGNCLSA